MDNKAGDFIWYELLTTDADASQAFYAGLLGWQFADSGMPEIDYRIGAMGDIPLVGFLQLSDEMMANGAHPLWTGYISVDDVDATASSTCEAGGSVLMPAQSIEDVGQFALLSDPQGAPFYVMNSTKDVSQAFAKYKPANGHCAWNELLTTDPAAAIKFYGQQFGWEKTDEMDMGDMGLYEMLRQDDYTIGAVMKKPAEVPTSMWLHYFRVADIDKAVQFTKENAGQVLHGPAEIPGDEFFIQGLDPQGALFAVIGKRAS